MSETVLYKLASGEEILATQISVGETSTVIDDIVSLVYHETDKGVSVGFAPFMPQHEGTITLWHNTILATAYPNAQVKSEHQRIFSKIVIAPAGSIIV